jgi:hypothetical protein
MRRETFLLLFLYLASQVSMCFGQEDNLRKPEIIVVTVH